jgi:hypothetical protein
LRRYTTEEVKRGALEAAAEGRSSTALTALRSSMEAAAGTDKVGRRRLTQ